jgi:hypothetical protein
MTYDAPYYHMIANGIRDIYVQELNRLPDEGGWIEWFHHWREDGRGFDWIRENIRQSAEWHAIHDQPQPVTLPRLVPAGSVFKLETGGPFTVIECSDFNLFGRYLTEGPDAIRPVLKERQAVGFNMLRVWSEYQGGAAFTADIGRLVPSEHANYSGALVAFAQLCSAYGLYIELTVFTGTGIPGHWERVGAAAQLVTNVILELANEVNAHPSINPLAYTKIPNVVCSRGSNGSQSMPVRVPAIPPQIAGRAGWWDYEAMHFNDAPQWARKVGHNSLELSVGDPEGNIPPSRVPVIANENTRPDKDGNINHFYDAAAAAALLCAGACFHSQSGKRSSLFTAADRPFAEAWVAGAKSVAFGCQSGAYKHRGDLEAPNAGATGERIYQRGNDSACIVRVRGN